MAIFNKKRKDAADQTQTEEMLPVSPDEALSRRQSSARPTPISTVIADLQSRRRADEAESSAVTDVAIGKEQIAAATVKLLEYKAGKAALEGRVVSAEEWYRRRQYGANGSDTGDGDVSRSSSWLFNALANKHADCMDNYPSPNILPREEGDKGESEKLSSIIPVILERCEFERIYSDASWDKVKHGTAIYGIYWDGSANNGIGDIAIRNVDILNLFWQPGVDDIQQSANVFHVELFDNDSLVERYPVLCGKLGSSTVALSEYRRSDNIDRSNQSAVIDWYYKKDGRLHYVKYVNSTVLFASENDPIYSDRGFYDHGLYPFVFDPLYPEKYSVAGFGYIDIGKNTQLYIDKGDEAILKNVLAGAKPRFFVRSDGALKEDEYSDYTKDFVHCEGNLGDDSIKPIQNYGLDSIYRSVLADKIEELKETTGNRDISTGGTTSGVTAASAIAAMQEAGSKLSRDINKGTYRAYRNIVLMCIELVRQFYDIPRQFRIIGEDGAERYITYTNDGILSSPVIGMGGETVGLRNPLFDIEVTAQKSSPYSKMAQNELALDFLSRGMFAPQMADQALLCLDMMDFDRKSTIMSKIAQNGNMYMQLMSLQQTVVALASELDAIKGTQTAGELASAFGAEELATVGTPNAALNRDNLGSDNNQESSVTSNARKRVAESTTPR